jgi:hypothetical protein
MKTAPLNIVSWINVDDLQKLIFDLQGSETVDYRNFGNYLESKIIQCEHEEYDGEGGFSTWSPENLFLSNDDLYKTLEFARIYGIVLRNRSGNVVKWEMEI